MVKIAVCQIEVTPNSIGKNLEKIKSYFEINKNKADIIIFPEKCNGILHSGMYNHTETLAFIETIKKLCSKVKMHCLLGSVVFKDKYVYYNRSFFIDNRGKILGHYDKIKIVEGVEDIDLSRGSKLKVFNTKFGKIGIAICLDLTDPILFNRYKKMGAEIILIPSMWELETSWERDTLKSKKIDACKTAHAVTKILTQARAIENELFIVFCNAAEVFEYKNIKFSLAGNSCVCEPLYGLMKGINHNKEANFIAEIDINKVERAKSYHLFYN